MSLALPLLDSITESMKNLSTRQRVIAQNIANSDTQGFKSQDVEAPDFSALLGDQGTPHVTAPRIQVTSGMVALGVPPTANGRIIADSDVSETKPDGNNVTIEDQMLKMGQVETDFKTMINLYHKQMSLIQAAIGHSS